MWHWGKKTMAKYRGFVGQVATLGCMGCGAQDCANCAGLGALRTELNGERYAWRTPYTYTTNKISPPTVELQEPAPVLEPEPFSYPGLIDPSQQEVTAPQYAEGGDGTAPILETTAKIDEAWQRIIDAGAGGGMYHPDDVSSAKPISCMRTNPNIQTLMPMVCKPNQAYIDMLKAQQLKTQVPITPVTETQEMPALVPLAIGAGLIWLMS